MTDKAILGLQRAIALVGAQCYTMLLWVIPRAEIQLPRQSLPVLSQTGIWEASTDCIVIDFLLY